MDRRAAIGALVALGTGLAPTEVWASVPLVVVVHAGNKIDNLSISELDAIFRTKQQNFDNGIRVIPFNLPPRQEHRVLFDERVLEMSPDEVARYWIDRRVRGGTKPPRQVPNVELLAKVIARLEGGIGYLPESAVIEGIRIVAKVA
jgi:hypothetical protein